MKKILSQTKLSFYQKQRLLIFIFSFILVLQTHALVNTYSFSPSTRTLDPMTTGVTQLIAAGQDDIASAVTAIGFNLVFNGTTYSQFSVSSNGLMRLGATVVSNIDGNLTNANSLISTTISDFPRIAPYWDNLRTTTTTGSVRYRVSGSSPNRILIVDWACTVVSNSVVAHFQAWLSETSNNIEFVYDVINTNTSGSYTVGLASSTSANDMASVTVVTPTFNSSTNSYTTANNSNTANIAAANSSYKYAIAPGCVGSLAPIANATNLTVTPTLSWAAGTGYTNGYDVYFGTAASPPRVVYNQAGTTYAPGTLNANTVYFWKVVARNDSAQAVSCSTLQFTTAVAPGCTTTPSPAASAANVATTATLSWVAGSGTTTGYDVYFGTAASPPLVSTNQAGTTYNPGALNIATTYFWKVVPNNNGAQASGCSTISFTTVVAPGCATSLSPAASATNQSLTTTLSWAAGSGTTTGYDVYFGTAASPPIVSTNQVGTTYDPGTLLAGTVYFWKVNPRNTNAIASCSTIQFTTIAAPGCTTNPSPAASATSVLTTATLSWTAGSGTTTGYDVYFGTASNPPLVVTNQAGTTYNPGTLNIATTYFWKVVPQNSGQLATGCSIIQFTTVVAPGCATSLSPAASATGVSPTVTLSWAPGSGTTTGYDVYFGTAASPPLVSTNQAGTTYSPGTLLSSTVYFWKVQPRNGAAIASCSTIQFTTAVPPGCTIFPFPANSATNISTTVTLSWLAGSGTTTGYDVYFGTAASPPLVSTNQAGLSYTPPTLNPATTYFWKVVPNNNGSQASGCSIVSFTTVVPPGCATNLSPAASAINVSSSITLSWTAGSGTTTGYDVYFGTSASPPIVSTDQPGTTYFPGTLTNGTVYFWKVQPRNGPAIASCSVIQFTTAFPPGCAGSLSPAASATNVSMTTSLSWAAGSGTTSGYDVYFGTAAAPPLVSSNQAGTTYNPGTLLAATVYFWKIVPQNNGAFSTGCSTNQFTTVVAPGCATSLSPAASATNLPTSTTLSWAAGSGTTTGYDVYFGTASNPPIVSTNQATTTYNPGTLAVSTTYFWKIVPRNGGALSSGCSIIQFTTIAPPGCETNDSPDNLSVDVSLNMSISWSAGTGVTTGYDVYFGTASNPPLVSTNQAGTSYTPATLNIATNYYWKVIPRNGTLLSTGCPVNLFTTIAPPACISGSSPSASAVDVSLTPTLSWAPGIGTTTGYDVYFGTASNPPLVSSNQPGTTYTPPTLTASTDYYWKIVPLNQTAAATGCSIIQFTSAFPPGCIVSASPAASAINVSATPVLSWSAGLGSTTSYDVYFGSASNPPLVSSNQTASTYTPGLLNIASVYYWKVVPKNQGAANNSCGITQFTTVVAPGCATSLSPSSSATGVSVQVVLSWAAGSGTTTGYDVYFGTASNPPIVSTNQAGTTYTPGLLLGATVYFWKVQPRNGAAIATCSAIQFTTLNPPGCAATYSPVASATNVTVSTTLSWTAGSGTTTGYDVYFGQTNPPPLVSTNQPGTTFNQGIMSATTTYFWKIVPQNNGALAIGCPVNQFSTVVGTSCATSISPADLSTNQPLQPTLSWAAGPGTAPTGYDVYFGTASNPPLVVTNQAGTTYSPGFLQNSKTYFWKAIPRTGATLATGCLVKQFTTRPPLTYEITRSTGVTFTSIAGSGSSVSSWRSGSNTDDNLSNAIPINFNFSYDGATYTSFLVSVNGFITFNTGTATDGTASSPYGYTNSVLSSGSSSPLLIAPFYDDLTCQGGRSNIQSNLDNGIKYLTLGSVGSRVLTVEWAGMETYNTGGPNLNFQLKLYEGTNRIEFVYGQMIGFDGSFNLIYSYSSGMNATYVSSTAQNGEVINQLTANTRNFGFTSSPQLNSVPECASKITFIPGAYTPYTPVSLIPSNDEYTNAIHLNVNPSPCGDLCGTYYTSAHATNSNITAACFGTPDDDVWFEFSAVNPVTSIKVAGSGGYDPTIEIFDNTINSFACENNVGIGLSETMNLTTLTIGQQYFVRVFHVSSGYGTPGSGDFSICISGVPIQPANDECVDAIDLPISAALTLGTSTAGATPSPGIPTCSASGTVPDDDVWYKFTASKAIAVVTVSGNVGFNAVIQLFSGVCGNLTPISCVNNLQNGQVETLVASGLTINQVYYIRVYHAAIGAGSGSYSISVSSPPPPCPTVALPPDLEANESVAGISLTWNLIPTADNYIVLLDTVNPPVRQLIVTTDTTVNTGFLRGSKTYYWKIIPGNGNSYTTSCNILSFSTEPTPINITVRVFLQYLYTGNHLMKSLSNPADTLTDSLSLNLYDDLNNWQYGFTTVLSVNGWATGAFPLAAVGNNYYLVINHRNSLETWSNLFTLNGDTTFDFSSLITSAYGNNLKLVQPGNVYVIYTGDVDQDGYINSTDLNLIGTSASLFETGYINTDINGDGIAESLDLSLVENNIILSKKTPFPPFGP